MQRNYEFEDKGSEAMLWLGMDKLNALGVQSMAIWLVKIQLMFKMTSELKGWILASDSDTPIWVS